MRPGFPSRISVIIPTLNEAHPLPLTLAVLHRHRCLVGPRPEVLVVDGGSTDATRTIGRCWRARVVEGPRGRARQLNLGASLAGGEILLFLHADTLLPAGWDLAVTEALADTGVVGGAFSFGLQRGSQWLKLVERGVNLRTRALALPYGDQALFCRPEVFKVAGGFPDWPLMEEVGFVKGLKDRGPLALLSLRVRTSARRWLAEGLIRTTVTNLGLQLAYCMGASPRQLAGWAKTLVGRRGAPPPLLARRAKGSEDGSWN